MPVVANSANDAVNIKGDFRIYDGNLVFSDGSVQTTATIIGPIGPQGPKGATGFTGPTGSPGLMGPACLTCTSAMVGTIDANIVGTWNATSYRQGGFPVTGVVTFKSDGTFTLESGSVRVFPDDLTSIPTGIWKNMQDVAILTQFDVGMPSHGTVLVNGVPQTVEMQQQSSIVYPLVVSMNSTKVVLERFGNITVLDTSVRNSCLWFHVTS